MESVIMLKVAAPCCQHFFQRGCRQFFVALIQKKVASLTSQKI
jgi:hypothetical protein